MLVNSLAVVIHKYVCIFKYLFFSFFLFHFNVSFLKIHSVSTVPVLNFPTCLALQSSDDEPREEKDHFVAQLYKFMEECGTPINSGPTVGNKDLDLYKLFKVGGFPFC